MRNTQIKSGFKSGTRAQGGGSTSLVDSDDEEERQKKQEWEDFQEYLATIPLSQQKAAINKFNGDQKLVSPIKK